MSYLTSDQRTSVHLTHGQLNFQIYHIGPVTNINQYRFNQGQVTNH